MVSSWRKIAPRSGHQAIQKYYNYLYRANYEAWVVLDPVITVHPDTVFYECFSKDESSYGKLSCNYNCFEQLGDRSNGTTNVDYSYNLYREFQKIREYRQTSLEIDPAGFSVASEGDDMFHEPKIDLPESWQKGFLRVSSAMAFPNAKLSLHPQDIYMICQILKQKKDWRTKGRALRFQLTPGKPVKILFEPWKISYECKCSEYIGTEETEISVWGRRRILILERLIPIAKTFHVYLLGTGMPYFFEVDLGDMTFTLGLSGWSKNNFSEGSSFEQFGSRTAVGEYECEQVFNVLEDEWLCSVDTIQEETLMNEDKIMAVLNAYTSAGRVIYDPTTQMYRRRELFRDPVDVKTSLEKSPLEQKAEEILQSNRIQNVEINETAEGKKMKATVRGTQGGTYPIEVFLTPNGSIDRKRLRCSCHLGKSRFVKGLCEHVLVGRQLLLNQKKK